MHESNKQKDPLLYTNRCQIVNSTNICWVSVCQTLEERPRGGCPCSGNQAMVPSHEVGDTWGRPEWTLLVHVEPTWGTPRDLLGLSDQKIFMNDHTFFQSPRSDRRGVRRQAVSCTERHEREWGWGTITNGRDETENPNSVCKSGPQAAQAEKAYE